MRIRPGDCVVSLPSCADPRFKNSVIMICQHSADGTFGVVLNRSTDLTVDDVMIEDEINLRFPMYLGGPVAPSSVWMLHSAEWSMNNTQHITEYLSYTSHSAMFGHLQDQDAPRYLRLFLGYTGWAPGQLAGEIKGEHPWTPKHSWMILKQPDPEFIWETDPEDMWRDACEIIGNQTTSTWLA